GLPRIESASPRIGPASTLIVLNGGTCGGARSQKVYEITFDEREELVAQPAPPDCAADSPGAGRGVDGGPGGHRGCHDALPAQLCSSGASARRHDRSVQGL